jgi:hypothetical protein
MSSNPQTEQQPGAASAIRVPGLGLVERAEPLAKEITDLAQLVDHVNVLNPFCSFVTLRRLDEARATLAPRVRTMLGESLGALRSPVNDAPGGMTGYLQAWSVGQALAATLLVQGQWERLVGGIDRKSAFTVAVFSIYISVVALLVTVGFGIATL